MYLFQKDANVGMCSTAALWMLSAYMHERFRHPRYRISETVAAAERYISIGEARSGYNEEQIIVALRSLGYNASVFPVDDPVEAK